MTIDFRFALDRLPFDITSSASSDSVYRAQTGFRICPPQIYGNKHAEP